MFYALLAGYLPFDDPSVRTLLHKVKRGIFQMPPFQEDLAHIIRRMLTVDPMQRATIDEIKRSACFLKGLNPDYELPAPIQFPREVVPIDPATLTEDVVSVLRQIGYTDDEELNGDLETPTWTIAKMFVALLTAQLDLDQLPWEDDADGESEGPVSINSWIVEDSIRLPKVKIEDAMYRVQQAVGDCGLQFFHPDPVTVYIRKNHRRFYVSVQASFVTDEELFVTARLHRGSPDHFGDFRDRLWQVFREQMNGPP
jgi:BR serine/threonine kinase